MNKAKKLSKEERYEIHILLQKGYSMRSIARAMNRSPNTISREIRMNSVLGEYIPKKAAHKARVRKKYSRFAWKKINENNELRIFIVEKLRCHWSPDEISGYMKKYKFEWCVSKNSIYRWLYSSRGQRYCRYLYSKRYTKKKRGYTSKRSMIPNRIDISRRSLGAERRSEYGHVEADTIVSGKRGSGALLVSVDRKSRYVRIQKMVSLSPREMVERMNDVTKQMEVKSITFDNGIENRHHKRIGVPTFFCEPYSSWQKGSVEHVNKMIRRYIPKGSDISKVSKETIERIQYILNGKPRKILGYRSALEIAKEAGIIKSECPN
jgi:IS30 family transposase